MTGNKPAKKEMKYKPNMNAQLLPHRPDNTGSSFVGSGVLQAYDSPYSAGYPAYHSYL
jgi:hypothetical protein